MPEDIDTRQDEDLNKWEENMDESLEQGDTDDELTKLKKEMIGHIVDKMKEKDQNFSIYLFNKDYLVDYLLDEWTAEDLTKDLRLWMGLNLLSSSAEKLRNIREGIKSCTSKEELDDLEREIISSFDNNWEESQETPESETASSWAATAGVVSSVSDNYTPHIEESSDSPSIWEIRDVPLNERKKWLFPNWIPNNKEAMSKYMTEIEVPIYTPTPNSGKLMTLTVNKKLANAYKAGFQEMYDKKIPVNKSTTWCFNFRSVRGVPGKLSAHALWSAVDINRDVNGWAYGKTEKGSIYYNNNETIAIWEKYGFNWWWNFTKYDPMHFSYTELWKKHRAA